LIFYYLKYILIFSVLIFLNKTFIWIFSISEYNITPDFVIVAVVYIGIDKGKIIGMVTGFFAGIIMDLLVGSFLGLSALSYCMAGFLAGYFSNIETKKFLYKHYFLMVVFICSVVANFLYYIIYFQGFSLIFPDIIIKYVLPTSAYTTLLSSIYVIVTYKKKINLPA